MRVRCKSGLMGYRNRLRRNYASFGEFEAYCEIRGLHTRLGYKSPKTSLAIQSHD